MRHQIRAALTAILLVGTVAACGGDGTGPVTPPPPPPPPPGPSPAVTVQVVNNQFQPATAVLTVGGTVTFQWGSGSLQHNVLPVGPATLPVTPNAPQVYDAPFSHAQTFGAVGTYQYYCSAHGTPTSGMRGTVIVQ